jgi:hypothetical protein
MLEIKWTEQVAKKDIAASKEYLTLVFSPKDLATAIGKLEKRRGHIEKFKAKDVLRASQTQLLPETNEDVRTEFVKILKGIPLVPIALVRKNDKLFIADGYHRTCAAYYLNKDIEVHCVVAGIE